MTGIKRFLIGGTERSRLTDLGLLIVRMFGGLALSLGHGLGKFPPSEGFMGVVGSLGLPPTLAWGSAIAEFIGGLCLAAGFLTRPAALLIVINHTVAVLLAHAGQSFGQRELALMFLALAILFVIIGAGRFSVDSVLRRRTGR
ncbi:MAG TPA: DoxX family protein [Rhodothermales bacterium]